MLFNHEKSGDVTIVTFKDKSLHAANIKDFKTEIAPLLQQESRFVFDMGSLQFIDSSGLGGILSCLKALAEKKGEIKLANLTRPARVIIELVNMHKVFDIYNNLEEALESF